MINIIDLMLYFSIYSFVGWMMESVFATINEKRIINRGFLTGFFCPIYGFGAVLILELSKWITDSYENPITVLILNVLFSVILVTVLEYITGLLLEKIFHCKWWDYRDNKFNLHGYVCVKYSLLWGVLAFIFMQYIHPAISEAVYLIPAFTKSCLAAILILYFIADTVKSVADAMDLRNVILNYPSISANRLYDKIVQYKRIFIAFPRLILLTTGILNDDIRGILNDRMGKIKVELKSRFIQR